MSQPQTVPIGDRPGTVWSRQIHAAANRWKRLNKVELAATEGDEVALAHLIARRYVIERVEAAQQVREFFSRITA